jgi:hypothetical protein
MQTKVDGLCAQRDVFVCQCRHRQTRLERIAVEAFRTGSAFLRRSAPAQTSNSTASSHGTSALRE